MILKWQTPEKVWHWVDCVEDVSDLGWQTPAEAADLLKRIDPEADVPLKFNLDAMSEVYEDGAPKHSFRYLVLTINGDRQHHLIDAYDAFVLSDEGKTIDRII